VPDHWRHSVIDGGPTTSDGRKRAKKRVGQFQPRSVLDATASLDDMTSRGGVADPLRRQR